MATRKRKVIRPRKHKDTEKVSKRKKGSRSQKISSKGVIRRVSPQQGAPAKRKGKKSSPAKKSSKPKSEPKKPKPKKGEPGYVSPADRLKPFWFKKGHKPVRTKGRPKGSLGLSAYLRKVIKQNVEVYGSDGRKMRKSVAQTLIDYALEHAAKGRFSFFKEIWDRLEGKVPDHIIQETTKKLIKQESEAIALEMLEIVSKLADKYMTAKLADKFLKELSEALEKRYAEPPGGDSEKEDG